MRQLTITNLWGFTLLICCWMFLFLVFVLFIYSVYIKYDHIVHSQDPDMEYYTDICLNEKLMAKYKDYARCHALKDAMSRNNIAEAIKETALSWGLCRIFACQTISANFHWILIGIAMVWMVFLYTLGKVSSVIHDTGLLPLQQRSNKKYD